MDNLIYVLFIVLFVPVLLMALLVEKRARLPMSFVLVGLFVAVFSSEVNSLLARLLEMNSYEMTTVVTPMVEELLKAVPILIYAIAISDRREQLFTASMATGVGFALFENSFFLLQNPEAFGIFDVVIRAFGAGLMHGMCTLAVGVGISFVKRRKKLFAVGTFSLLTMAISYHAIYNMLVQSKISAFGALLPIATYIPFLVWRTRLKLKQRKSKKETADA